MLVKHWGHLKFYIKQHSLCVMCPCSLYGKGILQWFVLCYIDLCPDRDLPWRRAVVWQRQHATCAMFKPKVLHKWVIVACCQDKTTQERSLVVYSACSIKTVFTVLLGGMSGLCMTCTFMTFPELHVFVCPSVLWRGGRAQKRCQHSSCQYIFNLEANKTGWC